MDPRPSLLSARGLVVAREGRTLVGGVDLDLRAGEIVALLGPNGAGKSSLVATLAGLLPAAGGEVTTNGRVAAALQAPALARRSAQANVEAALAWWGLPKPERAERAAWALQALGAAPLARRRADQLSGGEARRVHLARALAVRAEVLLLDEPFAGLDAPTRADLLRDAGQVLRDPERATLIVLHDRAEAWALADRLLVLLDGRIAAEGTPAEVLERPPSLAVAKFLGFSGWIGAPGEAILAARPSQVQVDTAGPIDGVVVRRLPEEDAVRCEVRVPGGMLEVRVPQPGPPEGEAVRLRVDGAVLFDADGTLR